MLSVELRPSLRLVQQIAQIERFAGIWDRIGQSEVVANDGALQQALFRGSQAAFLLDSTSPPETIALRSSIELLSASAAGRAARGDLSSKSVDSPCERFMAAHLIELPFDAEGLDALYRYAVAGQSLDDEALGDSESPSPLRTFPVYFSAAALREAAQGSRAHGDERVFQGVNAFLVQQRLSELIEWTELELSRDRIHPLLVIGIFHLLFLQILPYPTGNHRLCLLVEWQLLKNSGFGFIRYSHPAAALHARARQYFAALRQSEQTAGTSWATANSWLELFLDSLLDCVAELRSSSERTITEAALTSIQKRIIDVVRTNGSVTRERIISETGINVSTVKYNLSVLAMKGHLRREGGGRTTSYRVM